MKREREKELLFRGSQIKEAIENWYNQNYSVQGVKWQGPPRPLMDLKDLLQNPYTLTPLRYLPQSYDAKLDKTPKCSPDDCAERKIDQDPITGKKWTIIRGYVVNGQPAETPAGVQGAGIIGVASKSDDEPFKSDFKDTALENMGVPIPGSTTGLPGAAPIINTTGTMTPPPVLGKLTKYSEWKFVAESPLVNDHRKVYRAYHESW